jgi:3-oxoacyl-[acyl-carrier-protein] synthase-3
MAPQVPAKQPRIVLTGMGHWFPDTVLDNPFFDALDIGSSATWIDERVGIKERRSVLTRQDIMDLRKGEITRGELVAQGRLMTMAQMAKEPWAMAKHRAERAGGTTQLDQLIAGTSIPDWDIPANACSIAGELGLSCAAFDINSACSTFVVNLHVARSLLLAGQAKSIGVINCERYTTRVDYTDRASCVLFGDSASAAILEASDSATGLELIDTIVHSDPSGYPHVRLPDGGYFSQNGQAVQKFAVTKTVQITLEILEKNGLTKADISYFIGHQANFRMLDYACQKNGIGEDRHLYNVNVKGNQGATGAPTVLSEHWGRYKRGDVVVVAVVGSGLTWGAALFRCL